MHLEVQETEYIGKTSICNTLDLMYVGRRN